MSTMTLPVAPVVMTEPIGSVAADTICPAATVGRRRVLMICQAFPPTGGPGVQRNAKFAKYLSRFGWEPVVWSADPVDQLPRDDSLTADLPDDLCHSTRPAWSYTATHRQLMRALSALGVARLLGKRRWDGLDWRALRFLHGLSSRMVPDDQLAWVLRSAVPLLNVARREDVDCVFSTYSPASNHLLGLLVQRVTGLPWVADFRDLWTDDYCYGKQNAVRQWIERRIERTVLRCADAVVGVTPSQTRILAEHVPDQAKKCVCISNGVDADDFEPVNRDRARSVTHGPEDRFVLTFAGWFLSDRVNEGLVDGLGHFVRWLRGQPGHFEFRVVGAISDAMVRRFRESGAEVSVTGYVPHDDAIRQMTGADVLLLPVPAGSNAGSLMPGKTFEYLASGRPILLVGPADGEAQRLVKRCRAGICVESEPDEVCATLSDLWRRWRCARLPQGCDPELLKPFTREHLAGRLAELLEGVRRSHGAIKGASDR